MKSLVKSEIYKLSGSELYKRLLVICLIITLVGGVVNGAYSMTGYEWFCNRQLTGGWAWIPLTIFISDYVAGDFADGIFSLTLMYGFIRKEVLRAKIIGSVIGLLGLGLMNTIVGTLSTTILNGFGVELNGITIINMIRVTIYYVLACIVNGSSVSFLLAVFTQNRVGTVSLGLITIQLLGSSIKCIVGVLNNMRNVFWKRIVDCIVQLSPVYMVDSIISPQRYKPHPFWLFLVSCSVWLIVTYLLSVYIIQKKDLK